MSEDEVNYVISSIEWVANYGHHLLSAYLFDWRTGNWTYNCPPDLKYLILCSIDRKLNDRNFLQALKLTTMTLEDTLAKHVVTS